MCNVSPAVKVLCFDSFWLSKFTQLFIKKHGSFVTGAGLISCTVLPSGEQFYNTAVILTPYLLMLKNPEKWSRTYKGSLRSEWRQQQQPPTTIYLHAKFQLQTYCICWDILWQKNVLLTINHPVTHPIVVAYVDTPEPQPCWIFYVLFCVVFFYICYLEI